jgi:hypothetical protein
MRKSIFCFLLFFIFQSVVSRYSTVSIICQDAPAHLNVHIIAVNDSDIVVTSDSGTFHISLQVITEMLIAKQRGSHAAIGGIIGGVAGTIAGIQIGEQVNDANNVHYGLYGLGVGGYFGVISGSMFIVHDTISYDLSLLNVVEKRKVLSTLLFEPLEVPTDTEESSTGKNIQFFVSPGICIPIRHFADNSTAESSGRSTAGFLILAGFAYPLQHDIYATAELEYSRYEINLSKYGNQALFHTAGTWTITTPSLGLKYCILSDDKDIFYLNGTIGAAMVTSPKLEAHIGGVYFLQTSARETVPAFSLGADWMLNRYYNIGVSYQYAMPRFTVQETIDKTLLTKSFFVKIESISLTLGYYF